MKIDVLGTKYSVRRVDAGQDKYMDEMRFDGYCDGTNKQIVLLNLKSTPNWKDDPENAIEKQESETLRHELIHAFLNESGLKWNSSDVDHWAKNEEMIDWFAIQFPKLLKAFKEAGCIEN